MKTYPIITFLATLVVFLVGPFSFEVSGSLLFAVGLSCVLTVDYGRSSNQLLYCRSSTTRRADVRIAPIHAFELAA